MIAPPDNTVIDPADEEKIFSRSRRDAHPWEIYFDGKARWLTLKTHFPNVKNMTVMIDMIWQAARRRGVKVQIRRDMKRQGVNLRALTKRATDAPDQDMEAGREKVGKSLRNHKASTQRRQQQKRG